VNQINSEIVEKKTATRLKKGDKSNEPVHIQFFDKKTHAPKAGEKVYAKIFSDFNLFRNYNLIDYYSDTEVIINE
jgi:hypothetical protein